MFTPPPLRTLFALALGSALAALFTGIANAQTPGPLASTLQPFIDTHVAAGIVVLVEDKDKVLDLESVGYSSLKNKTPMATDDLFWIASMSKSLTATAFMMLVDEGKVSIDDPVEKYLPEFKGQMVVDDYDATRTPVPARHPILIREILSHTSGMIQEKDLTRAQFAAHDDQDLKKVVADYAAAPLKHQPGTTYEYNNAGINTAGRIIEVVSGMPYAEFMQTRLFGPLGMKDTTFWPTQEQGARLARSARFTKDKTNLEEVDSDNYSTNKAGIDSLMMRELGSTSIVPAALIEDMGFGTIFTYKMHYAMPAGGVYSTAGDLGRFCQMLLNGGVFEGKRYLSEDAIKQMTTSQTEHTVPNPHYALAWEIQMDPKGVPAVGTFAHSGARRTRMWVDPKDQLAFVLLMLRMDLPHKDEQALHDAFLKTAIAKYGKGGVSN